MKLRGFRNVTVLLTVAIALVSPQAQVSSGDETIVLSISTKKDSAPLGGEIVVAISMTNMHKASYCYTEMIEKRRAEWNGFSVEVTDHNANVLSTLKQKGPRSWSDADRCLQYGGVGNDELIVNRLVNLSKPGTYQIKVSHRDKITNQMVWSNSISVTVTA